MDYLERIVTDPNVLLGKPVIKGTRISVEFILKRLSEGMSYEDFTQAYKHITKDDILAALTYSAEVIGKEQLLAS